MSIHTISLSAKHPDARSLHLISTRHAGPKAANNLRLGGLKSDQAGISLASKRLVRGNKTSLAKRAPKIYCVATRCRLQQIPALFTQCTALTTGFPGMLSSLSQAYELLDCLKNCENPNRLRCQQSRHDFEHQVLLT